VPAAPLAPATCASWSASCAARANTAREKGRGRVDRLDLGTAAGLHLGAPPAAAPAAIPAGPAPAAAAPLPTRERIEEILRAERGNVTRAAQRLGLHRNQLRRWLARNDVDPRTIDDEEDGEDGRSPPHGTPTPTARG